MLKARLNSLGVLLLINGLCISILAAEAELEESGPSFFTELSESLSGDWTNHYFAYFDEALNGDDDHYFQTDLRLSFSESLSEDWSLKLVTRFRQDTGNRTEGAVGFLEDKKERYFAAIDELVLEYYGNDWGLSLGKQYYTWSVGDLYRPADGVNAIDASDLPTLEKIGAPALSMFRYWELFDATAVFLPAFTPSRTPTPDNRWFPDTTSLQNSFTQMLSFSPTLDFGQRNMPDFEAKNFQGGVRLTSSNLLSGWDFALSYFRGIDPVGIYEVRSALPAVQLVQTFPRYQEWATSFSTTVEDWAIYGEGTYHRTDDDHLDDSYLEYVLGANYSNYDWFSELLEETRIVVEYAGESVLKERSASSRYIDTKQYTRPFSNSLLWALVFKFDLDTELRFGGAYNFEGGDALLNPAAYYKLDCGASIVAGFDIFVGDSDSFFGAWDDNDRFSISVEYPF